MVWSHYEKGKQLAYIGKRMITISVPNKKKRGRPKRKFMDAIKEDMEVAGVNEEDAMDRENGGK